MIYEQQRLTYILLTISHTDFYWNKWIICIRTISLNAVKILIYVNYVILLTNRCKLKFLFYLIIKVLDKIKLNYNQLMIAFGWQNIEDIVKCVNLGSVVAALNINSTKSAFAVVPKIWKCNYFITNIKVKLFRANILSALLYGKK